MIEQTLVLIKQDAIKRSLIGEIIKEYEKRGLKIVAMKMLRMHETILSKHYAEHKGKIFYEPLIKSMLGPGIALVVKGVNAITEVRKINGVAKDPASAPLESIRGKFSHASQEVCITNGHAIHSLVHGSDSIESAKREIAIFFSDEEIQDYTIHADEHMC